MFAGIVEAQGPIMTVKNRDAVIEIHVKSPAHFNDIKKGDSIAVNGVCLTLEAFNQEAMQFAVGHETLQVTTWQPEKLKGTVCNLERSLALGDRIHGHLMSGHVEARGEVIQREEVGENLILNIVLSSSFLIITTSFKLYSTYLFISVSYKSCSVPSYSILPIPTSSCPIKSNLYDACCVYVNFLYKSR